MGSMASLFYDVIQLVGLDTAVVSSSLLLL